MQKPDACRSPGDQASTTKKIAAIYHVPQLTLYRNLPCRNLPSTATYRTGDSVPQFAYCRNLPPAATYRLPEFFVPQLAVAATFRSPLELNAEVIVTIPCPGLCCTVFANKIAKLQYLVQTAYNDPIHDFPPLILPERQGPERAVHPVAPHVLPLPQPERLPPP